MNGPDMSYNIDDLVGCVDQHAAVSDVCGRTREALARHGIELGMYGALPGAAGFHAVLVHVLECQSADANVEAARRSALAQQAGRAAGLGKQLITETSAIARGVPPRGGDAAGS